MHKAIFLDRDGVLNRDPGYVHKVEDFELLPGVIEGLKLLKDFKLIIITNQSGIGRGYYTEEQFHEFNDHLVEELSKEGIKIEKTYFCPHHPDKDCSCRKPNATFIKEAEKEFDLDIDNSWMIGDHDSDVGAGKNAGTKTIYLLTGHGVKHLDEARKENPDYIAANLRQAVDFILHDKEEKIISEDEIGALAEKLRQQKKKIVTINGTFDILHKGHELILSEAKKQGDILIVGLNSDQSVKQNKGASRPLNTEQTRARMLTNLDFVDYVVVFGEKTPLRLLEKIKPDIHVNGSDYGESCIEADTVKKNGGKIYVVELLEGYSTTNLIGGS